MLRVIVDSGSSIKQDEKEKLNVEIIPLRLLLGEKEYLDGIDLTIDEFYTHLIDENQFPKTSLPSLDIVEEMVNSYTQNGDDVIIVTISSKISGTFNALKTLFSENEKVKVIDSFSAVGGVRLIVEEINRNRELPLEEIIKKVNKIIPKIRIFAIPETLNYLLKGGRLSNKEWLIGTILNIKPIITILNGTVKVINKKIGLTKAMKYVVDALKKFKCDMSYPIIPSYTYNKENLEKLLAMTDKEFLPLMNAYDNLDPAIACHWGPNAFGYIFVSEEDSF